MTLGELDEVLRVWKARLAAIAENLLDLQSESAYRSLTGTGGLDRVAVTGLTAARVKPALGAMHAMFERFGLLQANIDQAEALRRQLPAFFGGEAKAREVEHLLFGKSIQLPAIEIPLEQRTLLGGMHSEQWVTPDELLAPMERAFAAARDAILSADRIWTEFAERSARVEEELARLRAQRALPSAVIAPALEACQGKLAAARSHMATDPLGAEHELHNEVEPALGEVARRVEGALQLSARMGVAERLCNDLLRVHAEAVAAAAEANGKVQGEPASRTPVPQERIAALKDWLRRLTLRREEGALAAVEIGLRNWNTAAASCVEQDGSALAAARECMERRSELRGRFDALKAKARRYGLSESREVAALGGKAESLLYASPLDLPMAADAVMRYERQLSGNGVEG